MAAAKPPSSASRPEAKSAAPAALDPARGRRRPFRDNPPLILAGIVVLAAMLGVIVWLADRTSTLSPDFLTEVVLIALSATNITMLVALAFVLARNVIKSMMESRRGLPFGRFRAKLVLALLGMTIIPAVLVLIVGSRVVMTAVDRWFNAPMEEILQGANSIAGDYYRERERIIADQATRLARSLSRVDLTAGDAANAQATVTPEVTGQRIGMVQVYRIVRTAESADVVSMVVVAAPSMPQGWARGSADRLAARAVSGQEPTPSIEEPMAAGGVLKHVATAVRTSSGQITGAVVASDYLSGELAERARRMSQAYEDYTQLRVLKQPLAGVYVSFFVMVTLLILVGSTWMGLYLAKRITRPVQMLSEAAREIGAGHYDHRIEHEGTDEFGSMVDAFNAMAAEVAQSRRRLERATLDLERKHDEGEGRRRYIEAILERIATGVVSIDRGGRIGTINPSAMRLLELTDDVIGQPAVDVFARPDLGPVNDVLDQAARARVDSFAQEVAVVRDGRERHVVAAATRVGRDGGFDGTVLVVDDVTPLIRAQKVAAWREVARRLAHEIKNPLTPIQLSAERLRRKLGGVAPPLQELVQECTSTIIGEVESLKGLVDEFSQFARMPAPRAVATGLPAFLNDTLALYDGLFAAVDFQKHYDADVTSARLDPEQMKRVMINLIDNAIEAMGRQGTIVIETGRDVSNSLVRIVVADTGPGIPKAERDKLFLPYYSTKGRGSGLGLAIVRRIVAEHGGSIDVTDNVPNGTRFIIELPC
ncbi:MAG: HAMP domain-containing protein [Acidimicrobiia bacterium]|nr:HAMP domain-containing protein [Acidimicrobiia bacterium]